MAKKTVVIDGDDLKHFCLAVDDGTVRVGDTPAHTEGVLRDLRVTRIRCEVEIDDDRGQLPVDEPGVIAPQVLRPGSAVHLRHAHLSLGGTETAVTVVGVSPAASADEPTAPHVPLAGPKRLKVIDGSDQGRTFRLPQSGTVTVGKAGAIADIGLHDLYVTKVHCKLHVEDGTITVAHVDGQNGTLVDGQRIGQPQVLRMGGVLRVGNSHLRLETGPVVDEPEPPDEPPERSGDSAVLRAPPVSPAPAPRKSDDPLAGLEGQPLGQYHIGRLLGRGFTGAVFHATNVKTGQVAALKVLAAEFPASNAELDRFARELKVAQQVKHPNLVAPYGAGRSGSHCWVARDYVEGESAAAVIGRVAQGDKPSWTRAARVAVHLARALECLHQHRVVHGNITPRNVLLRTDDNATKLTDLRMMQALEGSRLQRAVLEQKLLAELPYLAPEQAEPGAFVDGLADLYAVGAVAYALVAGRPPVTGNSPEEILEHIQAGHIVRPSSVYRKVPAAFDAIVMKLLAHNQEDRYQTAAVLLRDLEPLAQGHDLKL